MESAGQGGRDGWPPWSPWVSSPGSDMSAVDSVSEPAPFVIHICTARGVSERRASRRGAILEQGVGSAHARVAGEVDQALPAPGRVRGVLPVVADPARGRDLDLNECWCICTESLLTERVTLQARKTLLA